MQEGNGKKEENCTSVDWDTWSLTVTDNRTWADVYVGKDAQR